MGMDSVEIVMLTEERFGISIADEEAEKLRTPGMLVDLVLTKLHKATKESCQSQRSFYVLRRALLRIGGVDRGGIHLITPIRSVLAGETEPKFWLRLQSEVGARSWPVLGLSRGLQRMKNVLLLLLFACGAYAGWRLDARSASAVFKAIAVGLATLFAGTLLLQRLLKPFEQFIPMRVSTLKDLVPFAATSDLVRWSVSDVSRVVRQIVEEVLAPGEGKYREDADFVKDLGLS
jgi:hypothetical protein